MNKEYLLKYGIALMLLDNIEGEEFYISELNDTECWNLFDKYEECRESRNITRLDMYYKIEETKLYSL